MTIADNGYRDRTHFIYPQAYPESAAQQGIIRARHETINSRLKVYNVLSSTFRHDRSLHCMCVKAIANMTQLMLRTFQPLSP